MASFFGSHCEFPVARLSMLYDVADGQTLHSLIVPPKSVSAIAPTCTSRMCPLTA